MSIQPKKPQIRLPKDALSRINLGNSFAEYDKVLIQPGIFVETPAILAAQDTSRAKCFFVGRRGTGKTSVTYFLETRNPKTTIRILPQISSYKYLVDLNELRDPRRQPFKSLVSSFKRALLDEILVEWNRRKLITFKDFPSTLSRERNYLEDYDFDLRVMTFTEEFFAHLEKNNQRDWVRSSKRTNDIIQQMEELIQGPAWQFTLLIDRVDESWDGSDEAVILLMALMHACVELSASETCIRPLLFLRENIFERVREIDNEFARLETCVVSMDWTREQLLEMIERRLNLPFNTKLPLRGPTWDYFFEGTEGKSSQSMVFDYCQERPRDILIYCSFAIEAAQSHRKERVSLEDLQEARRRFSDSRLKDLGDEYAENYPQIQYVLSKFYGLGKEYTSGGIQSFLDRLLSENETRKLCGDWIYDYSTPDRFISILYNIGFFGIRTKENTRFRTLGPKSSTPPPITSVSIIVVHPSYVDALNLQDALITSLDKNAQLKRSGLVIDLPEAIDLLDYQAQLKALAEELSTCPQGDAAASQYEDIVGKIIRLCFFRSLTNVEPRVRDIDGRVIRDWIVANRADFGFWQVVRQRYEATQVIWECKNYSELGADVFHQCAYYMTKEIGRFVVLCFRGEEIKGHHFEHIKRVAREKEGGIVLPLTDKDLHVFIRQALNGKHKEDHIQELYDKVTRKIS